ncbi:MAG TPA: hypothetical protein VK090_08930 [Paracoccaceae bacterium]|nr:hypothetical protein [Paracoccaceae bacterium]
MNRPDLLIKTRKAVAGLSSEPEPAWIAQDVAVVVQLAIDQPRKNVGDVHHLMAAKASGAKAFIDVNVVLGLIFSALLQPLDALYFDDFGIAYGPSLPALTPFGGTLARP